MVTERQRQTVPGADSPSLKEPWTGSNADRVDRISAEPLTRPARSLQATLWGLLRAMRPLQWVKNVLVFAALVFDERIFDGDSLLRSFGAFVAFCSISSSLYFVNDLRDIESDRVHPRKRNRPLAAGVITPREAIVTSILLGIIAVALSWVVRPAFTGVILAYAVLMLTYSAGLKRLVILDVFAIAAGFVLRAAGGAIAIGVPISPWLYVCTLLLSLFVGFGKRRSELSTLEGRAAAHRANLDAYTLPMLDQLISIVASATVMAYALYTFDASNVPANHAMMLTIPFVTYAIFRYLYLIHRSDLTGSPETLLFRDVPLLLSIIGWGLTCIVILYRFQ